MSARQLRTINITYLQVLGAHNAQVGDTENETYCVEDVGLAGAVQAGDRVKAIVPACCERLESLRRCGKQTSPR